MMPSLLALLVVFQNPTSPSPRVVAESAHVVIVATTDVHGRALGWDYVHDSAAAGGLSRAASILETLRSQYPNAVVVVDAGDLLQGNPLLERYLTEVVWRCALILSVYGHPHDQNQSIAEHEELITLLDSGDADGAGSAASSSDGADSPPSSPRGGRSAPAAMRAIRVRSTTFSCTPRAATSIARAKPRLENRPWATTPCRSS